MARIRKKQNKELPAISTASLPDIIFILLFFFMVATVMKDSELKVKVSIPAATELEKLDKKRFVAAVNLGVPLDRYRARYGALPRLQINDKIASVDDIKPFIRKEKGEIEEKNQGAFKVSLKIDKEVNMKFVTDVKTELRKAKQLKINYATTTRTGPLR